MPELELAYHLGDNAVLKAKRDAAVADERTHLWSVGGGPVGLLYFLSGLAPSRGKSHSAGMAIRDRFEIALACSKCGTAGIAQASETDHAVRPHPDFQIDDLPDGFTIVKHARYRHETKVACENCGKLLTP